MGSREGSSLRQFFIDTASGKHYIQAAIEKFSSREGRQSRPAVIVRNPDLPVVDGDSGGSGEIPEPTVKVWMGEENGTSHGWDYPSGARSTFSHLPRILEAGL